MRRDFCNGTVCVAMWISICLLVVLSLSTLTIAKPFDDKEITAKEFGIRASSKNDVNKTCCSPIICYLYCPYGFKVDEDGCPICECKDDPCRVVLCPPGQICKLHSVLCLIPPCDLIPVCENIKGNCSKGL